MTLGLEMRLPVKPSRWKGLASAVRVQIELDDAVKFPASIFLRRLVKLES